MMMNTFSLDTSEQVQQFLAKELGYYTDASEDALMMLYYVLTMGSDLPNSNNEILKKNIPEGLGEWFIYFLVQKGLIEYGIMGCKHLNFATTEWGEQLLTGLGKFAEDVGLNMEVANQLADDYYLLGHYMLALEMSMVCLAHLPEYPLAYHTKAEILVELGRYEEALQAIEFVILQEGKPSTSDEESPYTYLPIWEDVYYTEAIIYTELQTYQKAMQAIEKSLAITHTERAFNAKNMIMYWLELERENKELTRKKNYD